MAREQSRLSARGADPARALAGRGPVIVSAGASRAAPDDLSISLAGEQPQCLAIGVGRDLQGHHAVGRQLAYAAAFGIDRDQTKAPVVDPGREQVACACVPGQIEHAIGSTRERSRRTGGIEVEQQDLGTAAQIGHESQAAAIGRELG
jgi:hypothetical protein